MIAVRAAVRSTVLAALAAALLSGCATDDQPLAVVGEERVTVADFKDAAAQSWSQFPFAPDSARGALLERMVQEALLVEAGRRDPANADSAVRENHRRVEDQVLTEALVRDLMPPRIPVSEAELRRLYVLRDSLSHVLLAYVVDEATAQQALAALRRGEDFGDVSMRFSLPRSVPPGGDAGWVAPGTTFGPLDDAIQTARVGATVGPIQVMDQGWFILRVVERKKQDQPPFETEAATLRSTLEQRKQRAAWLKTLDRLRAAYQIRTDADGMTVMFRYFNRPTPMTPAEEMMEPPPPTAEEKATVLGRWDGGPGHRGAYTLGDAIAEIAAGTGERPNPSMMPSLEQWTLNRMMERVARLEARRRRLHEVPENARRIRNLSNQYLATSVIQTTVLGAVQVGLPELRAEYDANAAMFSRLVSARFEHLTVPDSGSAARIAERLRGVRSLREAVLASSGGIEVRDEVVPYPNPDPAWAMLEEPAQAAREGTVFPPIHVEGRGWRITQLVAKELRTPAIEEQPFEVQQMLMQRVTDRLRDARMKAVTDSLRRLIPVVTHRDRLRRLPWPPKGVGMPFDLSAVGG